MNAYFGTTIRRWTGPAQEEKGGLFLSQALAYRGPFERTCTNQEGGGGGGQWAEGGMVRPLALVECQERSSAAEGPGCG